MLGVLQVLLFRRSCDEALQLFEDAVIAAFQGGKDAGGYVATGEDLGIQIEAFSAPPELAPAAKLNSFSHTMVVALIDLETVNDSEYVGWLAGCVHVALESRQKHEAIIAVADERTGDLLKSKYATFERTQMLVLSDLGEKAVRPALLSLKALHHARQLMLSGLQSDPLEKARPLKLFISHAKMDGLPLAGALKHQIDSIGLRRFYDADDLPAGCDWQRELEKGVASSIVVMLRTDAYDGRYWCQQEVLWADEYAVPAVVVDARTSLHFPPATLPFGRIPSARIPDGNLLRIIHLALREALRAIYFLRGIEVLFRSQPSLRKSSRRVFSYAPSMAAVLRACDALRHEHGPRMILYPDPPLRTGAYEAANALVERALPGTMLVTPLTLAAMDARQ